MQGEEGTAGSVVQPGQVPPAGARHLSGGEPAVSSSSSIDPRKVQGLLLPKTAITLSSGWGAAVGGAGAAHACTHTESHARACTHAHIHMHATHTNTHAHIHMHPCMHNTHTCMHTHTSTHTHAQCTHIHTCTRVHTHAHTCAHTHTSRLRVLQEWRLCCFSVHQLLPLPRRLVNVCGVESSHRDGVSPEDSRDPCLVCPFLLLGQVLS